MRERTRDLVEIFHTNERRWNPRRWKDLPQPGRPCHTGNEALDDELDEDDALDEGDDE